MVYQDRKTLADCGGLIHLSLVWRIMREEVGTVVERVSMSCSILNGDHKQASSTRLTGEQRFYCRNGFQREPFEACYSHILFNLMFKYIGQIFLWSDKRHQRNMARHCLFYPELRENTVQMQMC